MGNAEHTQTWEEKSNTSQTAERASVFLEADSVRQKFIEKCLNAGHACILLATKLVFWIFILKVNTIALKAFSILCLNLCGKEKM